MKHVTRTFIAASIMVTGLWFAPVAANAASSVPRPFGASEPVPANKVPRPFGASDATIQTKVPRPGSAHSNPKPRPFGASSKPRPIHANKAAEHCAPKKAC
jgi:hypothetical protein